MAESHRNTKYVVLPVQAVRMLNIKTPDQVVEAQSLVDADMIAALEEMVNAAKSKKLTSDAALSMAAIAW